MTEKENFLRAVRFGKPNFIPMHFSINPSCWHHYSQEELKSLMASHPFLFPGFKNSAETVDPDYPPWQRAGIPYTDPWGCVWKTTDDGITGSVTKHPLENWDNFESYIPPDPNKDFRWGVSDWRQVAMDLNKAKREDRIAGCGLRHGHTFLTLIYIRGYENLIFDMADDEPRLYDLIRMVENFNMAIVRRCIDLGAEMIKYPEDLGMQVGPMLSPDQFRKYIKPSFRRLMEPAKKVGCIVNMHSDGDIRELADDLIECGVDIINLQDLVNGIDWIADNLAGRICIDLDIDRQQITRFGTPGEIDSLIRMEVEKLGKKNGGLMMCYGLYPGIPFDNIEALMTAMERYAYYG